MKRKIVITIDCNAKTCGKCHRHSYEMDAGEAIWRCMCGMFPGSKPLDIDKEEHWLRCPECIAAEVKK
jgi:hypothetical protein